MKKEDLLNDDFLEQFKSGEEPIGFLKQTQKQGKVLKHFLFILEKGVQL